MPSWNTGDAAGDVYVGIEALVGSAYGDALSGDGGNNMFWGLAGADWIEGQGGNDTLYGNDADDHLLGGAGADWLDGGNDFDYARYDYSGAVTARLDAPWLNTGDAAGDAYVGIEGLVGSAYGDVLFGDGGNNMLWGQDGSDSLMGLDGNDGLHGGGGSDAIDGGAGADTAYFDGSAKGYNWVSYNGKTIIRSPDGSIDVLTGVEYLGFSDRRVTVRNNALDYLASYWDLRAAFGTNETVGFDHFANHGVYEGRRVSFDAFAYIASYSDLIQAFGIDGATGAQHYITNGAQEGRGISFDLDRYLQKYGDLRNWLGYDNDAAARHFIQHGFWEGRTSSNAGEDVLAGSYLDDVLDGGTANDTLTGGGGNDQFIYQPGFGNDVITDFDQNGDDQLQFSTAVFSDWSAVWASTRQVGSDVVITSPANNTVTLQNVAMSSFGTDDVRFVA
jgi:Ca2+-binding RTX toxin-like protein